MKLLVLGTSHSGAVRRARETIAAQFPTFDVTFFGLPGGDFGNAQVTDGIFAADATAQDIAQDWNGCTEVDLTTFDHVLLVGERFGLESVLRLLVWYDTLEEPERRGFPVMSRAAMTALIESAIATRVASLAARFAPHLHLSVAPAPYPLMRSWRAGKGHERKIKALAERAHAEAWIETYEALIAQHMEAARIGFVPQPYETRSDAFRTLNRFALTPLPDDPEGSVDNRHMNSEYGAILFESFARDILDITPAAAQKSEDAARG